MAVQMPQSYYDTLQCPGLQWGHVWRGACAEFKEHGTATSEMIPDSERALESRMQLSSHEAQERWVLLRRGLCPLPHLCVQHEKRGEAEYRAQ